MDFDPKTSELYNEEEVNKYLASYDFCLKLWIKSSFVLRN